MARKDRYRYGGIAEIKNESVSGVADNVTDIATNAAAVAVNAAKLPDSEDTATTGASPIDLTLAAAKTVITTGGTAGTENINALPSGGFVGERKTLELGTLTDPSDSVSVAVTNQVLADGTTGTTSMTLDAENEFALLEWNGAKWQQVYSAAGVIA